MTIHVPSDREQFIRSLVEGGRYPSQEAVIDDALRLLEEHDEAAKLAQLRQDVAASIDQANRGELAPFDPQATLARVRVRQAAGTRPS
jgi:putative addiction module CopG family antidote